MEYNEIIRQVGVMTGRPDVPGLFYIPVVCEEIRLSGLYPEDLIHRNYGEYDFYDIDYELGTFEFYIEPMHIVSVQVSDGDTTVDLERLDLGDWKTTRKCPPVNSYYESRGTLFGRTALKLDTVVIYGYDRLPFEVEGSKVYQELWPTYVCPAVVLMGMAAKVMLAVGDDPSRDRYYTEYQRLLRQFQLSRIETNN